MNYRPDYGLALKQSGVRSDFQAYFYSLYLDHISAVAPGQFTTLLTVELNGTDHALSLDFSAEFLPSILRMATPATISEVVKWVAQLRGPDSLQLPELVQFGVRASLGEEENANKETYIPMIIRDVM
jgi:hypothetical protein